MNSAGSSNQQHFAKIPSANFERSTFDRSSTYKTTFDAGKLIPFFVDEVLPGDTMNLKSNFLARLATPITPYMDNVYLDVHYFFVPNRLVFNNWEKMNGAQEDPGDSTDFLTPQLDATTHASGFGIQSIYDYMGLPVLVTNIPQADMPNALLPRAYNLIWNEWFRDENLQNSLTVDKSDGPDTTAYAIQSRGRRKDYFTSCLPWPQKGPAVSIPLGSLAPVQGIGKFNKNWVTGPQDVWETNTTAAQSYAKYTTTASSGSDNTHYIEEDPNKAGYPGIYANLDEATAATINSLREAFQLQRLFERDARGGTRYVEILLSHFGVVSPDFRLQRPEYLGGGTMDVNVNPIAQTSESTTGNPQGNLASFAVASGRKGFTHSFVEHGHVIGLISVRAETTYQQGLNRMWSRRTRFDYYWPTLAHLGEQAVLNKEIYIQGGASSTIDNTAFGYQERWAEYRYRPSTVTGKFRSNDPQSLDFWHLALDFTALPTLAGLIPETPPIERIVAVTDEPEFILDSYTTIKHTRPMPTYSVPGLIDHF